MKKHEAAICPRSANGIGVELAARTWGLGMSILELAARKTRDTLRIYWELVRIIVPVTVLTEAMARAGIIEAMSPALAPVMQLFGLPPEFALVWMTGVLVGIWGAVPVIFTLVPPAELTVADITVISALLLFAHALPIEQKIIQKAGPGFVLTTALRIAGGMIYALILHHIFAATGWLSHALNPAWIPMAAASDWLGFFVGLVEALIAMFLILLFLAWGLELLKWLGIMDRIIRMIAPLLRLAGIRAEAAQFTMVGLLLGISYGGGLLVREARSGSLSPRQIFISCVFMGFAHAVIEDTLVVMAIGADAVSVLVGRVVFAVAAAAVIAWFVRALPDSVFCAWAFNRPDRQTAVGAVNG